MRMKQTEAREKVSSNCSSENLNQKLSE